MQPRWIWLLCVCMTEPCRRRLVGKMPRVLAALVTVRDAAMRCELCGSCAVFDAARLDGRIRLSQIGSGPPDGSGYTAPELRARTDGPTLSSDAKRHSQQQDASVVDDGRLS